MQEVVAAYKDKGTDGVKQVQSTGLHIAGERFVVLKADDRSIYGKKVRTTTESCLVGEGKGRGRCKSARMRNRMVSRWETGAGHDTATEACQREKTG